MSSCTITDAPAHDTDLHGRLSQVYFPLVVTRFFKQRGAAAVAVARAPRPWRWRWRQPSTSWLRSRRGEWI